jgi:hypothetical protein
MGILGRLASILEWKDRDGEQSGAVGSQAVVALNDRVSQRTSSLASELGVLKRLEARAEETVSEFSKVSREIEAFVFIWEDISARRLIPKRALLEQRADYFRKQVATHRRVVALLQEDLSFAQQALQRGQQLAAELFELGTGDPDERLARIAELQNLGAQVAARYVETEQRVAAELASAPRSAEGVPYVDPDREVLRLRAELERQGMAIHPPLLSATALSFSKQAKGKANGRVNGHANGAAEPIATNGFVIETSGPHGAPGADPPVEP